LKTSFILKTYTKLLACISLLFLLVGCVTNEAKQANNQPIKVRMSTTMGDMIIQLYQHKAPQTVSNFLSYVDAGDYHGGNFYRVVRHDNDNGSPKITVIQGDVKDSNKQLPPIKLETTDKTGIKHLDGTLSMARLGPDTATSSFFVCIGAQPSLDFGGARNSDGQGFAAFGQVIAGMDVVKKINALTKAKPSGDAYMKGQMLLEPVVIKSIVRIADRQP
jgi:peptidyl-prolyl cis-trans isomerase A (cyclophilin A)